MNPGRLLAPSMVLLQWGGGNAIPTGSPQTGWREIVLEFLDWPAIKSLFKHTFVLVVGLALLIATHIAAHWLIQFSEWAGVELDEGAFSAADAVSFVLQVAIAAWAVTLMAVLVYDTYYALRSFVAHERLER